MSADGAAVQHKARWGDLFRDGRASYTILLNLGIALNAVDVFIISTVLPTVVHDIGGAAFYAWAIMLYMVGTIVGSASAGPLHTMFGRRRGLVAAALVFMAGSTICAVASSMAILLAGRLIEGLGGGLIVAQSMALISEFFEARLRTRALAFISGTWGAAALIGPLIGGVFAEIDWWRGAFWSLLPALVAFCFLAWRLVPEGAAAPVGGVVARFPARRIALLALGILSVGLSGQVDSGPAGAGLIVLAALMVWLTIRLDTGQQSRLFPSRPLWVLAPVGVANWVFFLISATHTVVLIYFPLKLQVVHDISPLWIGYIAAFMSFGWTLGSLAVAHWSGLWERFAIVSGLLMMVFGILALVIHDQAVSVTYLATALFLIGIGIGLTNVHMTARVMGVALRGEESITASSIATIRSIGIAFGAALAGLVANTAGLGDGVTRDSVAAATEWVFLFGVAPPLLGTFCALQFLWLVSRRRSLTKS